MKNFLINLNITILLIVSIVVGYMVYQDVTITKERTESTRAYFLSQAEEKGKFPTKKQKNEMELLEIEDAKRIVEKHPITGEKVVFYTYTVYTPTYMNKILNKTMMPLRVNVPKSSNL